MRPATQLVLSSFVNVVIYLFDIYLVGYLLLQDPLTEKQWVWALVAALLSPGGPMPAVAWSPRLEGVRGERENLLRGLDVPCVCCCSGCSGLNQFG